ncbi:Trp biosynthesis-associated membrane protein [Plantactinospora sp. WMMB782]|uniref:Trp biosynthesis-associated membrane protein n=1 Tax=Plantactinospora sp. WMMB782 TaxID=3404121 RepID=UPI003B94AF84
MAYAVLLCLLGAGLAVLAATRTWSVELTARPVPLPPDRAARTGGDLLPWLPALALVGLAGAGALLGTRGIGRRLVGGLLALLGAGVAAGAGYAVLGTGGEVSAGWPLLCALGGLLVGAAGVLTALRGAGWPVMGARYDRARPAGAGREATAPDGRVDARRTTAAWDALDRGEDPTAG